MELKLSDIVHRHPPELTKPTVTHFTDEEGKKQTITDTPTRGYAIVKFDLATGRVLYTKPISRDEAMKRGVSAEE